MLGIEISHLNLTYPGAVEPFLKDLNLIISRGQIVLISGGNGSGKSTLLACISGVIPALVSAKLEGRICFGADKGRENVVERSTCGVLLQDSDIYLLEEVYEELAFPLQNAGITGEDADRRIEEAAALLGISGLLDRKMASLSGGERQKVAIGAALVSDAPVLLLDEPAEQLDPQSADELWAILKGQAQKGKTVLVSMHNPVAAARWADRIVILDGGRMSQDGFPAEILRQDWRQDLRRHPPVSFSPAKSLAPGGSYTAKREAPILEVQGLTHRYDNHSGIENISFQVYPQEIFSLMGPNGAGKSTLIQHFLGLLKPQAGKVILNGRDIAGVSTHELAKTVGILFQNPDDQLFNARVDEEIAWSLVIRGVPKRDALAGARELASDFGLEDILTCHPHDLNRSLRQWVALASVLITKPKVLILDEPTKMMDADFLDKVMNRLLKYRDQGGTIVMVTHDAVMAGHYSDRIAVLAGGRLRTIGKPGDLYYEPIREVKY